MLSLQLLCWCSRPQERGREREQARASSCPHASSLPADVSAPRGKQARENDGKDEKKSEERGRATNRERKKKKKQCLLAPLTATHYSEPTSASLSLSLSLSLFPSLFPSLSFLSLLPLFFSFSSLPAMAPKASSMTVKQLQAALKKKKIDFDKKAKKAELVELLEASEGGGAGPVRSCFYIFWKLLSWASFHVLRSLTGQTGAEAPGLASSAAPCEKNKVTVECFDRTKRWSCFSLGPFLNPSSRVLSACKPPRAKHTRFILDSSGVWGESGKNTRIIFAVFSFLGDVVQNEEATLNRGNDDVGGEKNHYPSPSLFRNYLSLSLSLSRTR